jgi:hypothetical protein
MQESRAEIILTAAAEMRVHAVQKEKPGETEQRNANILDN